MHDNVRGYRAICFDLDGTLLPMDIDEFMGAYFARIGAYAGARGLDAQRFMAALKDGTYAMASHDDGALNKDAFWAEFAKAYGAEGDALEEVRAIADEFYESEFGLIGEGFAGNPDAPRAIDALVRKGYPLVLATMPMFPLRAVQHRLAWAGVDPAVFARITTYENSTSVKPKHAYYAENLAALGLAGEDVLIVGNNTLEDLAFCELGADAYLVTDWLLDPVGLDVDAVRHGTFAEFADWVETLPDCKNPACGIRK